MLVGLLAGLKFFTKRGKLVVTFPCCDKLYLNKSSSNHNGTASKEKNRVIFIILFIYYMNSFLFLFFHVTLYQVDDH